MPQVEKDLKNLLIEAKQHISSAKNLVDSLYPQLNDSNILLKSLEQLSKAENSLISLVLKIRYIKGDIRLSQNPKKNRQIFFDKVQEWFSLDRDHIAVLRKTMTLGENYRNSGFTFPQQSLAVIMNDDGTINKIDKPVKEHKNPGIAVQKGRRRTG